MAEYKGTMQLGKAFLTGVLRLKDMTALIFPEEDREDPFHGQLASSKTLQQLLQEPLSALSQWYRNVSLGGGGGEGAKDEVQLVQFPSNSRQSPALRGLHETCLSSLHAGTASIAASSSRPNGVNFLNLPVNIHTYDTCQNKGTREK